MAKTEPNPTPQALEDAAFVAAVGAGQASLDAGRGVAYEAVRRWLLSWGTRDELPAPKGRGELACRPDNGRALG